MNKNTLYSKVFGWLGIGLLITFAVGYYVSFHLDNSMFTGFAMISIFAELAIAFVMGLCIAKLSPTACTILYLVYCVLSGLNFSIIFITYKVTVLGRISKVDFRKLGVYLLFTLLAVIIGSLVNIFIGSSTLSLGLTVLSIIVFMLYILYDMKMIDNMDDVFGEEKAAVYGAFQLYIDFINLFIDILRFIGKAKD